jgi:hypothetical protein
MSLKGGYCDRVGSGWVMLALTELIAFVPQRAWVNVLTRAIPTPGYLSR